MMGEAAPGVTEHGVAGETEFTWTASISRRDINRQDIYLMTP